jgi:predicted nuclease with TOPRIM domain
VTQEPSSDMELLAQRQSSLSQMVNDLQERMKEVEKVNTRLEGAALTTSRAMQQIAHHWDAVYEAMRRTELDEDLKADLALRRKEIEEEPA